MANAGERTINETTGSDDSFDKRDVIARIEYLEEEPASTLPPEDLEELKALKKLVEE